MTPNFVADNAPLMSGDFILSADLNPSMTWNAYSGILAEVQVSLDSGFKSTQDNYNWVYNSDIHTSAFSLAGTTGSLTIPQSDAFENGTYMHYRMRSMDSTGILGSWETGSFFLPEHDVIDNGDGTATIAVDINDLSTDLNFIEDAVADENNKNTNYGSSATLDATLSSTKETIPHFRFAFDALGMHSNATILDASLNLTRSTSSGSATLALHEMDNDGAWNEDELTWLRKKTSQWWRSGGRGLISHATDTGVFGSQISDDFSFDLTSTLQQHIDNGNTGVIDFALTTRSETGSYSANAGIDSVTFHSSDATTESDKPYLYIKYDWGTPVTVAPSLTSPYDGETLWNQTGHNFTGNTTPSLTWSASTSGSYDMIFEFQ